jgi:hypothetical protein
MGSDRLSEVDVFPYPRYPESWLFEKLVKDIHGSKIIRKITELVDDHKQKQVKVFIPSESKSILLNVSQIKNFSYNYPNLEYHGNTLLIPYNQLVGHYLTLSFIQVQQGSMLKSLPFHVIFLDDRLRTILNS